MAKKIEVDEDVLAHCVDTAYAAYALSQLAFIALVEHGIITHEAADELLRNAMAVYEKTGGFAGRASPRLKRVRALLEEDRQRLAAAATPRPPTRPS